MKPVLNNIFILLIIVSIKLSAQSNDSVFGTYYVRGIQALSEKDTAAAEKLFKKSIRIFNNPESFYQLAKLYFKVNTVYKRIRARELLENAVLQEPRNIKYKFLLAEIMERMSNGLSYKIYKQILEIDSTSAKALYNLGRIKAEDFDKLHNSVMQTEDNIPLSLDEFAQQEFKTAEFYLKESLKYDSLNRQAYLHLGFLYEDDGKPEKGILYLQKLQKLFPDDMEAHLYLGLLYYESGKIEKAYNEYKTALSLMSEKEREDFTFNSVKELIKPIFGDQFKKFSTKELKEIIKYFWRINDPLYLTKYNERLLEHYSRVAYANLRFSERDKNHPNSPPAVEGWKTDRGEVILRYGMPLKTTKFRPYINAGGRSVIHMRTEVWQYKYFSFGFTDQFMNGRYVFSEPDAGMYVPQFNGDSPMLIKYLRKAMYMEYTPKFEGPVFKVPYNIVQLKSGNYNYTDVYVNYGLFAADSLKQKGEYIYPYKWGLFFFDTLYYTIIQQEDSVKEIPESREITIAGGKNLLVNSLEMSVYPDTGHLAFEIIRKRDKGVSSNHFNFSARKFEPYKFNISDIILATKVVTDSMPIYAMHRGKISILPNPTHIFSPGQPLYIYYELYNMKLDSNGTNTFQQKLILEKENKGSFVDNTVNSLLNVFGLGKHENSIIITTNYESRSSNPQMYYQLDMSSYPAGDYILNVIVKDKQTGKEVSAKTLIHYE